MTAIAPPRLAPILLAGRHWFVIDKPAGVAVHAGPRTPQSLEDLLPLYAPGRPAPQAVHRLDRDTSGCLLIARRASALRALSAAFAAGQVRKLYWAVVVNPPAESSGLVSAPLIKRSTAETGWRMHADPAGMPARTHWEVLDRRGKHALLALRPETGRTHQIRVHAALLGPGSAIVGDPVYGAPDPAGMMLHARELGFTDPETATTRTAEAPCPDRFMKMGFSG